jgi:putative PIN family toxin of toxin-antitoxin system
MPDDRPQRVVIDTNCVLDLWVFDDPAISDLKGWITSGQLQWVATAAMRDEWVRVLEYPAIQRARVDRGLAAAEVLQTANHWVTWRPAAPHCPVRCRDPDDQMFINLAAAEQAMLVSKDRHVLALKAVLSAHGVPVLKPGQIKNLIA